MFYIHFDQLWVVVDKCDHPLQSASKVGINFLNKNSFNFSRESEMCSVCISGKCFKFQNLLQKSVPF